MDATYVHVQVLKVLADRRRLEIIHLLGTGARDAPTLASALGVEEATVRRHLSALMAAGLVDSRQSNGAVLYVLSDPEVMAACELMRGVLRRRLERLAHRQRSETPRAPTANGAVPGRRRRGS